MSGGTLFGLCAALLVGVGLYGIVVAFSATALAVAVLLRLFDVTGSVTVSGDGPAQPDADAPDVKTKLRQ